MIGALSALLLVTGCGGDEGTGAQRSTTSAAPVPPGPPTGACALLAPAEVEAVIGPPAGKGAGTQSVPRADTPPGETAYADCSWPDATELRFFLTWVQPPPAADAEAWVERMIGESGPVGAGQRAEPLDLDVEGLDAVALVDGDQILRVVGIVDGHDLLSLEALDPVVTAGSPQDTALTDALVAAAGRL